MNLAAGYGSVRGSVQEFAADEAACKAAKAKLDSCKKPFGVKEKHQAAKEAAEATCKTEYDAAVKACPDDQGEDDQGDSPQM